MEGRESRRRVFLVRHGHSLSASSRDESKILTDSDDVLSETGEQAIKDLSRHLTRHVAECMLLYSPLPRAQQSAKLLIDVLKPSLALEVSALAERRLNFPLTWTKQESRKVQEQQAVREQTLRIGDGESVVDHGKRVRGWFNESRTLIENFNGDVIIVSHGGTMDQIFGAIVDRPIIASTLFYPRCDPAHYHLFSLHPLPGHGFAWRLDGINCSE